MGEQTGELLTGMADAGCTREEIEGAERLLQADDPGELTKHLRRCRAGLLDQMHESQRRVDRMDYLIRQTDKSGR